MSTDEKRALVRAQSSGLARTGASQLAARGLLDLALRGLDESLGSVRPKGRVLLVHDQAALLDEMEHILVTNGYRVRSTCKQQDAIDVATAFFEPHDVSLQPNGGWLVPAFPPKTFTPQFVMLGTAMPVTLGSELFKMRRLISKLILWGEALDAEDLERRREYYEFELLRTPLDEKGLVSRMKSWLAEAWTGNACLLSSQERHLEALECHEEALAVDPLCFPAWTAKGWSLGELGRWPEALASYDRAIEILPRNQFDWDSWIGGSPWSPWVNKGDLLNRMGQFDEAVRCFDSALAIRQNLVSGWEGRGWALHNLGVHEEAIRSYDKVLEMDFRTHSDGRAHTCSFTWNLKGIILDRAGRREEADECWKRSVALDPKSPSPWYSAGNALRRRADFEGAIRCYERVIELYPNHGASWNNKSICLRDLGRFDEALECCEKALSCEPPEVLAWHSKARTQEELGQIVDAIKSYEKYLVVARPDQAANVTDVQERLQELKSRIAE